MKKISTIVMTVFAWILAAAAFSCVVAVSAWFYLSGPVVRDSESEFSGKVTVASGDSIMAVGRKLEEAGFIRSGKAFYYAARFGRFGKDYVLKSGTYVLKNSMSMKEIASALHEGTMEIISITVPEGLAKSKIGALLEERHICSKKDFLDSCSDPALLAEFNVPAENFEGYLFPDTYFLSENMDAEEVVRVMVSNFYGKVLEIPGIKEMSPEELHSLVILSSVVEREYRDPEEAPVIASVFTNRLRHNIGLYSCATIEYIITEINGLPHPNRITYKDLKIDSPYNTYMWSGLPQGPISNPGLVAISAAKNPAQTKFYYFVLTDAERGRHTFSENFDQHKAAENLSYVSK